MNNQMGSDWKSRNNEKHGKSDFQPYQITRTPNFKWTGLVDEKGVFHKSANVWDAKKTAESLGMQLICFKEAEGTNMALCKILDFGKWKYENEKNKKKISKSSKHEIKEVWFSPNIEEHDLHHKLSKVEEFIGKGDEVHMYLKVEGRDLQHMDIAESKFNNIVSKCNAFSKVLNTKRMGNQFLAKVTKI